jgi:Beta-propeller repeat
MWRFVGANQRVRMQARERLPGTVNSLRGNDPARWRTGLPRHAAVRYRHLWPGVDLTLRGKPGTLKYEFRVQPGARVGDIRLAYRGAKGISVDRAGALLVKTAVGVLRDSRPVAYQEVAGRRVPVASRFVLEGRQYGFAVGASYRRDRELIIDPGFAYSTLLGGASDEDGTGIAVDSAGNAYLTGFTQSPNFPTTPGAFDRTGSASNTLDAFVSKLNATGTALVYSTFLGGGNTEKGRDIAVDASGNAYVTGQTWSPSFPTTGGAFDRTFNVDTCPRCGIDQQDGFVTKLNPAGSALVYSTFLGGTQFDDAMHIALDGARNAYVTGETGSSNFPTTAGAFDRTANGGWDAFVTKLNAAGSALVYSTRLGGADNDPPGGVAVDGAGSAYIGGSTRSADFPTTAGAFDTTHSGGAFDQLFEAFVTKLNATGSAPVYSTFIGGTNWDSGGAIAVDAAGSAYLSGVTASPEFPTTPGAFDATFGGDPFDAFVTKLNAAGSALFYSTFSGGAGTSAIAVDAGGNAWLGGAAGPDGPTTPDAPMRRSTAATPTRTSPS